LKESNSADEKSLQKIRYGRLSIAAAAITLNLLMAGYVAFGRSGETLDYPFFVPFLQIYFWLLMLPSLMLVIFYRTFRLVLAGWMLIGYILICAFTGLL
jgi:hypothetical protein